MKSLPPIYRMIGSLLIILVLPFTLVVAASLFSLGHGATPHFSSWVMGSLTILGALALLASIADCVRHRRIDWFWLFLTASATIFWGSVFLNALG